MALGAERRTVLAQVLKRGLGLGGVGLFLGLGLAVGLGRFAESQLFGVGAWDPGSLGAAGLLLLLATLTASCVPARRAASVDSVRVLKGE